LSASTILWALVFLSADWHVLVLATLVMVVRGPALLVVEMIGIVFRWSEDSRVTDPAYLCVSLAFPGVPVPLYHVRFVNGARTRMMDGMWGDTVTGNLTPYTVSVRDFADTCPGEWCFLTAIPWAHFEQVGSLTALYSPMWNCQTAALATTRGMWASLGLAGLVLVPTVTWCMLVTLLVTVCAVLLMVCIDIVPVLYLMLSATGNGRYVDPLRAIVYHHLHILTNYPSDWYGTVLAISVGLLTGWGTGPQDVQFRMAQVEWAATCSFDDLCTGLVGGRVVDDVVARTIVERRLQEGC